MHSSMDSIRRLLGIRHSRCSNAQKLRTLVWYEKLLRDENITTYQLDTLLCQGNDRLSNLPSKWANGTQVTQKKVDEVADLFPGSDEIYNIPLFELLDNKPLSKAKVKKLLAPYNGSDQLLLPAWIFPNDKELAKRRRYNAPLMRYDSDNLFQRGDIYGFMAIVGLVREAEVNNNAEEHLEHIINCFRAFPSIAKSPDFSNHAELLKECLIGLHHRSMTSALIFEVDWNIINEQIRSDEFETFRERRDRDPKTYRYKAIKNPIIIYEKRVDQLEEQITQLKQQLAK